MSPATRLSPESADPTRKAPPKLTLVEGIPSGDARLVAQALRRGTASARAEEDLFRRYHGSVARLAASFGDLDRDEAADVVQESFVRAFRSLASLKDPERFGPWLFTIARNRARSYLSSRATHAKAAEEAALEASLAQDFEPPASQQLEREVELRAVREIIDGLREGPEKETVRLFYVEGSLSAREIADRMGVGKSAVTMRLERFRTRVRKELTSRLTG